MHDLQVLLDSKGSLRSVGGRQDGGHRNLRLTLALPHLSGSHRKLLPPRDKLVLRFIQLVEGGVGGQQWPLALEARDREGELSFGGSDGDPG